MEPPLQIVERRLQQVLLQLKNETTIFERLMYKNANQHRRALYFRRLCQNVLQWFDKNATNLTLQEGKKQSTYAFCSTSIATQKRKLRGFCSEKALVWCIKTAGADGRSYIKCQLTSRRTPWSDVRYAVFSHHAIDACSNRSPRGAGDVNEKSTIEARIFQALERKEVDVAKKQLRIFFKLSNVTLLDCNQMLKKCLENLNNAQVATLIWMFMLEKQIRPNTYSTACLLRALCGRGRLREALKLMYKLGEQIPVQPHIVFCSIFLNGCFQCNSPSYADQCLLFMKKKGLKADELVYLELLRLAGKRKDLGAVRKAWSRVVQCCKPDLPSVQSYCAAIKSFSATASLVEALLALKEMLEMIAKNKYSVLPEGKFGALSLLSSEETAHTEKSKIIMEEKVLGDSWGEEVLVSADTIDSREQPGAKDAQDKSSKLSASDPAQSSVMKCDSPPLITTNVQDDNSPSTKGEDEVSTDETFFGQILGWIRLAIVTIQRSELKDLSESLQSKGSATSLLHESKLVRVRTVLRESLNHTISAAASKGQYRIAEELFGQMHAVGLEPDVDSYNGMLKAVAKEKGLAQGFQLVKSMEEHGVQPNTKTYNAILDGFCRRLEVEKAEALLQRMLKTGGSKQPSVISFNTILRAFGILDDPLRTLRVFSKMVDANIKPDICTILILVQTLGRVNFPLVQGTEESQKELARRLQAIETYMDQSNLPHNCRTFNTVLAAFCTEGMADTVMQRLHLAEGRVGGDGLPIVNTVTYNIAINACHVAKQWSAAEDIFKRMLVLGLNPDRETYNIVINGCAQQRNISDAFHYLDKMQEGGLKPDSITYNTLIKVYCYAGQLDAAVGILRDMEPSGMTPDIWAFGTTLRCAVQKERLDVVELLVEHMHQKKIQPTLPICEHVVSAYLNCDQVEDAAEALRVLSTRMLPPGVRLADQSEDILKQVFLEDSLLVNESTRELLEDAMVKQGAVSESLLAARLSGLGNACMAEWNPEESSWAKRLRAQYTGLSSGS